MFLTIEQNQSYKDVKNILIGHAGWDIPAYGTHYPSFSVDPKKVLIPYKNFSTIPYSGQAFDYDVQLLLKLPSG